MSTETLPPRATVDTSLGTWTTEELEAPPVPHEARQPVQEPPVQELLVQEPLVEPPVPSAPAVHTVAAATLAAHAIDRADARLERLRDELDLLRVSTRPGADIDAEETRLMFAITEAEQSRQLLDA
jgi:hypothetical protein